MRLRKGIPLPLPPAARYRYLPLECMEVGDSFVLDRWPDGRRPEQSYVVDCRRLVSRASKYGLDNRKKFACRFLEGGLMGCWRTK